MYLYLSTSYLKWIYHSLYYVYRHTTLHTVKPSEMRIKKVVIQYITSKPRSPLRRCERTLHSLEFVHCWPPRTTIRDIISNTDQITQSHRTRVSNSTLQQPSSTDITLDNRTTWSTHSRTIIRPLTHHHHN